MDLVKELGNEHELKILEKVKENRDIFKIENDLDKNESFQKTKSLMSQGVSGIYQASLIKNNFNGYADLILKTEGKSKFGSFLYVPIDIKIATNPKPSAIIQLCCYVELLESIQGTQPPYFEIVTKNNQYHRYQTYSFFFFL